MVEIINKVVYEPWPWWVGGPLIGVFVVLLLLIERKPLGISSSFQYICAKVSPIKLDYFNDTTKSRWQFFFVIGLILGGVTLYNVLPDYTIDISPATVETLGSIGVSPQAGFVPSELFNSTFVGLSTLFIGGLFLGFGARYANGCTAGHAIMGVAQLSPASILATVFFFVGGLFATYFIVPNLF